MTWNQDEGGGVSYCGYHCSAPAVVPPVADPSVYIVTWAFFSRINCKLMFAVIACWGTSPSGYTSQEPLLAQGQSNWFGRGSLEVSVLGSSFIRFWVLWRSICALRFTVRYMTHGALLVRDNGLLNFNFLPRLSFDAECITFSVLPLVFYLVAV